MSFPKVREITLEILERCGINGPPVDLEPVLELFKARVVNSRHIAQSALLNTVHGWTIKVNSSFREERRCFRIAHEIGHIYWTDSSHHSGDPDLGGQIEKFCSKFASLLLCPHQWLLRDAPEADFDLFELKKIYLNLSHEALTLRLCRLTPMVVTIMDNGRKYRRFGSPGLQFPGTEQKLELEVYESVDLYGEYRERSGELKWEGVQRKVRVRGYPVFSGSFRRIILVLTPLERVNPDSREVEEDMPYPFPEY